MVAVVPFVAFSPLPDALQGLQHRQGPSEADPHGRPRPHVCFSGFQQLGATGGHVCSPLYFLPGPLRYASVSSNLHLIFDACSAWAQGRALPVVSVRVGPGRKLPLPFCQSQNQSATVSFRVENIFLPSQIMRVHLCTVCPWWRPTQQFFSRPFSITNRYRDEKTYCPGLQGPNRVA